MRISVDWHSTYRFGAPVRLLNMELRVVPAPRDTQQLVEHRLEIDPEGPVSERRRADVFGNTHHRVDLLGPLERVRISLRATVEASEAPPREPTLTPLLRHLALAPTARTPRDPALEAFAREAGDPSESLAYAGRLSALIAERFEYELGHTSVEDTAVDLLRQGRGVCQDFAHLMLAVLRARGIPALYVSGYLAPPEGSAEGDASHAWVRVHAGGAWHGFDPANRSPEDARHVVTALGRDYDDVAPVRGSYRGLAEESWSAVVRVEMHGQQ